MSKKRKNKKIKQRDFNILLIIKGEINCRPKKIKSKKIYNRKKLKRIRNEDYC